MVFVATRSASTSRQARAAAVDGADDLVHVDRLGRAVALGDAHRRLRTRVFVGRVLGAAWDACNGAGPLPSSDGLAQHDVLLCRGSGARPLVSDRPRPRGRLETTRETDRSRERARRRAGSDLPASLEASRSNRPRMSPAPRCWQVFGLTSAPACRRVPTVHRFPVPNGGPVRCVEFVLDYRCGAAPDVRRVPFSALGRSVGHQHEPLHMVVRSVLSTRSWCRVGSLPSDTYRDARRGLLGYVRERGRDQARVVDVLFAFVRRGRLGWRLARRGPGRQCVQDAPQNEARHGG